MEYTKLFRQLTDSTRLRILLLLRPGPLCVCHLTELLEEPQARVSKNLNQLRRSGLLQVKRVRNWSIYRIAQPAPPLLETVLGGLEREGRNDPQLKSDLRRRDRLMDRLRESPGVCPLPLDQNGFSTQTTPKSQTHA